MSNADPDCYRDECRSSLLTSELDIQPSIFKIQN